MNVRVHRSPPGRAWDPHCGTGRTSGEESQQLRDQGAGSTGASQHGFLYDPEAEVPVRGSERRVGPTSV